MTVTSTLAIARSLRQAGLTGSPLSPHEAPDLDIELATAIASEGRSLALAEGEHVVGYKIGLTAEPARTSYGHDSPVHGYLLESRLYPSGGTIPTLQLLNPQVEAEIAFILGSELNDPETSTDQVIRAIAAVAPAVEIVDSRWTGGAASLPLLVADNTNAAASVLGEPVALPPNLSAAASSLTVGDTTHEGHASIVLGDPIAAVTWLARHLAAAGTPLQAGDIVLSGSTNVPAPLGAARTATARIDGLGSVSVHFD